MTKNATMCLFAAGALLTGVAAATAQELQPSPAKTTPTLVEPIAVAKVLGVNPDGTLIVGEAVPYRGTDGSAPPPGIYDGYEGAFDVCQGPIAGYFPANGSCSGGVDPACGFGGGSSGCCGDGDTTRWWFGAGFVLQAYLQKLESLAGNAANGTCSFTAFAWGQAVAPGLPDQFNTPVTGTAIAVITYDNTIGDMIGAACPPISDTALSDGFHDGVVLLFGPIDVALGYYYAGADLTGGFEFDVPSGGAIEMSFHYHNELNEITGRGYQAQAMLWNPKDAAIQGSNNGIIYFNDPAEGDNGDYSSTECADFSAVVDCPQPLTTMVGTFGEPSSGQKASLQGFTLQWGSQLSGDLFSLVNDDNDCLVLRSGFFFTAQCANRAMIDVQASTTVGTPSTVDLSIRDTNNNPGTSAIVRMRNYNTGAFQQVGTYGVNFGGGCTNDTLHTFAGLAADFVSGTGQVETRIEYCNLATFTPQGFDLWIDQVSFTVFGN